MFSAPDIGVKVTNREHILHVGAGHLTVKCFENANYLLFCSANRNPIPFKRHGPKEDPHLHHTYNHGQTCWDSYRVRTLFNTREIVAPCY